MDVKVLQNLVEEAKNQKSSTVLPNETPIVTKSPEDKLEGVPQPLPSMADSPVPANGTKTKVPDSIHLSTRRPLKANKALPLNLDIPVDKKPRKKKTSKGRRFAPYEGTNNTISSVRLYSGSPPVNPLAFRRSHDGRYFSTRNSMQGAKRLKPFRGAPTNSSVNVVTSNQNV